MSFKSYLIEKFATTHENKYFRELTTLLFTRFSTKDGAYVLIGNISCNGHQMDAVFIARGQITVIDFKDYSGEVIFSENNPWRLKSSDGGLVFVQGGAQSRNPFQQVKAYRFSLAESLKNNEAKIFSGLRENINWMHIGCIVLFHRTISFDISSIPAKISRFFHITDTDGIANLLTDLYSSQLELDDQEINSILYLLDVREENLYSQTDVEGEETSESTTSKHNLSVIKKVARSCDKSDSLYHRELSFYRTLVSTERYKEPSVDKLFPFPFAGEFSIENYPVNLTENDDLHQIFLENQQERFPKNIFIGIDVNIDGKSITTLFDIVPATDIPPNGIYQCDLNNFELHGASFEEAGLAEDIIEELSQAVGRCATLQEKLYCISEFFDTAQLSVSRISLGLSQESLVSAQLISELKKLGKLNEASLAFFLKSFLSKKPIQGKESKLELRTPFIQVTQLNDSQKKAIKSAFEQPLTVVTGPPGTGKSQVVVNIIANAIVNGYSVLFASKNNKAVDTVKERFDKITEEPYLIRFGSRDQIQNSAIPEIKKQIARQSFGNVDRESPSLDSLIRKLSDSNERWRFLQEQIDSIPLTESQLNSFNDELKKKLEEYSTWEQGLEPLHKELFIDNKKTIGVDVNDVNLLLQKIHQWSKGRVSRVLFKLFNTSKLEESLRALNDSLDKEVKKIVDARSPWACAQTSILSSGRNNLNLLLQLASDEEKISAYNKTVSAAIRTLEENKLESSKALAKLKESEADNRAEITAIRERIIEEGADVLNATIRQKLTEQDLINMQCYIDYLPANKIWKDEDVASFTESYENFLKSYSAICLTSLAVKNSSPLTPPLIDLLVIDEASQCDVASAIPLIARAKQVVVIGDPLQLRHITSVQKYEQEYLLERLELTDLQLDYVDASLFDHCFKLSVISNLESVFLAEHYRCNPEIAEFSSKYFYQKRLGQSMSVNTKMDEYEFGDIGLTWINVNGTMDANRNINLDEVSKCIELASELASKHPTASIGIVTPFKDQYKKLFSLLSQDLKERIKVDTVHKYQGDEKDIIIFSLVVTANSSPSKVRFLNNNEYLINVAITRARSALYIVGNFDYCKTIQGGLSQSPLKLLSVYADSINKVRL